MIFDRSDYINQPIQIEQELNILFKQDEALTIFEIGACEGEDSIKYARLFPHSKIYAFEPLPGNIELIKNNLERYGIRNIYYFTKALSSKEGTAEFFVSQGRPKDAEVSDWDYGNKSSSLLPPGEYMKLVEFIEFKQKIEVQTITINSFCKDNDIKIIDFVHMDVQGAELMVLEGAGDFITSIKAVWLEVSKVHLYENQPLVDEVKAFMYRNNFALVRNDVEDIQGDHLYVSKVFYPNYKSIFPGKMGDTFISRFLRKLKHPH